DTIIIMGFGTTGCPSLLCSLGQDERRFSRGCQPGFQQTTLRILIGIAQLRCMLILYLLPGRWILVVIGWVGHPCRYSNVFSSIQWPVEQIGTDRFVERRIKMTRKLVA